MLRETIQRRQQQARLEKQINEMPEYPIYREQNGRYLIYVDGECRTFASEAEACAAQLAARAAWLRRHS